MRLRVIAAATTTVHGVEGSVGASNGWHDGAASLFLILVISVDVAVVEVRTCVALDIDVARDGLADVGSGGGVLIATVLPKDRHELSTRLLIKGAAVAGHGLVERFVIAASRKLALDSDDASVDAVSRIAEDEGGNDVHDTKGEAEDASSQNKSPKWESDVVGRVGGLVQLSQDVAADEDHGDTEPGKAMMLGKYRPGLTEVRLGNRKLGNDEEDGGRAGEKERGGVKEEPSVGSVDLDDKSPARHDSGEETDDGKAAEDLEEDHPRTTEACKHDGCSRLVKKKWCVILVDWR